MKRCSAHSLSPLFFVCFFLQLWFFFSLIPFFHLFVSACAPLYLIICYWWIKMWSQFSILDRLPPPASRQRCASLPPPWLINALISAGLSLMLSYSDSKDMSLLYNTYGFFFLAGGGACDLFVELSQISPKHLIRLHRCSQMSHTAGIMWFFTLLLAIFFSFE